MTGIGRWVEAHREEIESWPAIPGGNRCIVSACDRSAFARSLCKPHYFRARRALEAETRKGTKQ
ncbi:MAG: hypothetical protein ACTHMQ_03680 [Protaetiibacter sp.]